VRCSFTLSSQPMLYSSGACINPLRPCQCGSEVPGVFLQIVGYSNVTIHTRNTTITIGNSGNRGVLRFRRTRRSFVRLLNGQAENGLVAEDKARQGLKYVKILKQQFITEKNLKLHNSGDMDLSAFEVYFDISQNGIRGR